MKLMIAALVVGLGIAMLPPPQVTVENPKVLYAIAMYKTAVGDTGTAVRLMRRAEASQERRSKVPQQRLNTAEIPAASPANM